MTLRDSCRDQRILPASATKALSMAAGLLLGLTVAAQTAQAAASGLRYTPDTHGVVPIPAGERQLQTVVAEPYFKVSDKALQLEGPAFDREGNLYFVEVFGGSVMKLTKDKKLSTVLPKNAYGSAGLAVHKDGRIFMAGLGNFKDTGVVVAFNPDGGQLQTIIPASAGYLPDDLVFDAEGGFYFTDFKGTSTQPTGGVYHVSPDFKTITPLMPNMAVPNGVALSPNGKVLWADEFSNGRLHRVELANATTIAPFGTTVTYQFQGHAPDSMRTDRDGNVYVAMYQQGRVLVFNDNGLPIGQILLPGREKGHNLRSTSLAFVPGTNEVLIVTNDADRGQGSTIYRAKGFAPGVQLFSHQ
ncbi:MAG: SMP-30/gluconolactonase/LRE family protein [Aquabacterium sp.]|jgi:lactonase|uniref:SMP-30/gluconolactonase/LRE family protein n=1 Tax=Aquabacterium sp. TaxID=1872578 RepID=UPI003BAF20ED